MIVLIGGYAMAAHDIYRPHSRGVDVDIMADYDSAVAFIKRHQYKSIVPMDKGGKLVARVNTPTYKVIEAEIAWSDSLAAEFIRLVEEDPETGEQYVYGQMCLVPSLNALYTLKMSHRYLRNSPFFTKTMLDIKMLRKAGAADGSDFYADWYEKRVAETYSYAHPKLNVSKDAFFTDDVPYQYDHDSIHEAVKLGEKPAYTYFLDGEVKTSKELFLAAGRNVQLRAVYEEACVLALERSVIPHNTDPKKAFELALEKVCTSITSGWFREFAWENYNDVLAMYDSCYVTDFYFHLQLGNIKPFNKHAY